MNFRTKLLASGLSVAAIAVLALGALWYFVLDTDAPPPVSIDEAIASRGTPPAGSPAMPSAPLDGDGLTGEWTLAASDSSFAGYRIDQQVAGIGNETVVGRTQGVEASFTFDGSAITGLQVTVDMTSLRSDESLRDSVLRGEALQTGDFPTATFVAMEAIPVDRVPAEGERVSQAVSGEMTLHGVTRPIETQLEAVLQSGQLIVVGSSEIQLSDFGITPPRGPASVLSVEDHGIMEVQLVFEKGGGTVPDAPPDGGCVTGGGAVYRSLLITSPKRRLSRAVRGPRYSAPSPRSTAVRAWRYRNWGSPASRAFDPKGPDTIASLSGEPGEALQAVVVLAQTECDLGRQVAPTAVRSIEVASAGASSPDQAMN